MFFVATIVVAGGSAIAAFNLRRINTIGASRREIISLTVVSAVLVLLYSLFLTRDGAATSAEEEASSFSASSEFAVEGTGAKTVAVPESRTATLKNYRTKGDSVKIECSGPTGSVVCKPAR